MFGHAVHDGRPDGRGGRRVGARLTMAALGVAALVATLAPTTGAAAQDPGGTPPAVAKGTGRLSPRLEVLRAQAGLRRSDAAENRAVGLLPDGPGSLLRGPSETLRVNARLTSMRPDVLARLARGGATVVARADAEQRVTLEVRAADLGALAADPGVAWAEEVLTPTVGTGGPTTSATRAPCSARKISEADTQLRAATARSTYSVNGAGVPVGILSDSYNGRKGAATDVANGELPGAGNPCGRTTPVVVQAEYDAEANGGAKPTDEGRGMAQLVHDLAPASPLRFATAFTSDIDFANQIRGLALNGARVIVDDVGYFNEPVYQDGIIAKAVTDVTAGGAAYFSSAGNDNVRLGGRDVGSYETPAFRPATCPASVIAAIGDESRCHDFDAGPGTDTGNTVTLAPGGQLIVKLGWNEPERGITTDLDLFLVDDATGAVAEYSATDSVTGSQDAVEALPFANDTGVTKTYRVVVGRYTPAGTPRFKVLLLASQGITAVERPLSAGGDIVGPATYGHATAAGGAGVAAVPYDNAGTVETFSSRGPARYCYGPVVGVTPAAPLPGGCEDRPLAVAATDGAVTSFFGQLVGSTWRFYGTSAAAPHAAAVAALQRQAWPCATPAQLIAAQRNTARSVGSFGVGAAGAGLVTADTAVGQRQLCPAGAPAAVDGLAGSGQVSLWWTAPTNPPGAAVTGYQVTPFIGGVAQPVRSFASVATSQTITGLTDGTAYTFRVAAVNSQGTGPLSAASPALTPRPAPEGAVYVPINPCRVVDTRNTLQGPLAANQERAFRVAGPGLTGQGGAPGCIPAGALAVEASVTAVAPAATGYFRAWPKGEVAPNATFLSFSKGQSTTNTGSLALAATGTQDLQVKNFGGAAHYVIDVQGYFVLPPDLPGGGGGAVYVPVTPCRVLDTRSATGGSLAPNEKASYRVAGDDITLQGGAPDCGVPVGASAVEASVTAVTPTANGFLRAWPSVVAPPKATFLNYTAGQGITNTGAIGIAADSTDAPDLTIQNYGGTAHYVIDVQGYYAKPSLLPPGAVGSRYVPITPCRVVDTRSATGGALSANESATYQVAGAGFTGQGASRGCIPDGASAVEASVTAVTPAANGYFRAWPNGATPPNATFLNFTAGQGITNTGAIALAPTVAKDLAAKNFGGASHYVLDLQGYFVRDPS